MSRTKCGLSGPVSGTPGTQAYQVVGSTSMNSPLAASCKPSNNASALRMAISCLWSQDEMAGPDVTSGFDYFCVYPERLERGKGRGSYRSSRAIRLEVSQRLPPIFWI